MILKTDYLSIYNWFQVSTSDFLLILRSICANSHMPTTSRTLSIYLNINSHNSQKKITSDRVILIKLRASNCSNIVFLLHSIFCLANKESHRSYNSRKNMFAERHVQKVGSQLWIRNRYKKSADLRQIGCHQNQLIFVGLVAIFG